MNDVVKSGDLSELEHCLSNLRIFVGKSEDNGTFTVYSTSEPLFCYERKTELELEGLVADTLRSYVESFYEVQAEIKVVKEQAEPAIPVKRLLPASLFKPHFAFFRTIEEGFAAAD